MTATSPSEPELAGTSIVPIEPDSLTVLMALDPLQLTLDDPRLAQMIEAFRTMRTQYDAGNRKAGSTKPKAAKAPKSSTKLNLEDLGL